MKRSLIHLTLVVPLLALPLRAQAQDRSTGGDSAAVVAAAHKFHASLAAGDSAGALALLTDDVQILESGGIEDRTHYREHHLPGDIRYAMSVTSQRAIGQVTVRGDVAWIVSMSTTTGQSGGRAVNSEGAELMVLVRTSQGWKIAAVHWSSRRRG